MEAQRNASEMGAVMPPSCNHRDRMPLDPALLSESIPGKKEEVRMDVLLSSSIPLQHSSKQRSCDVYYLVLYIYVPSPVDFSNKR